MASADDRAPPRPQAHWCPKWWQHAEAISRLTGLWVSWEAVHTDSDIAMLNWYQDHLDTTDPCCGSNNGPFHNCFNNQGHNRSPGVILRTMPCPNDSWGTGPGGGNS